MHVNSSNTVKRQQICSDCGKISQRQFKLAILEVFDQMNKKMLPEAQYACSYDLKRCLRET